MLPLFAALVVFGAIVSLVLALTIRDTRPMAARMAALRGETFVTDMNAPGRESLYDRVFDPLAQGLQKRVEALLPMSWVRAIEKQLVQAGQPVSLAGFLFAVVAVEGAVMSMMLALVAASGGAGSMTLLLVLTTAILGAYLPRIWLQNRVRHRQKDILRSLPDAFDLITVCVEAGLGLDAALGRVADKVEGPFADELHLALREISLGKLRRDALKEMGERTGVPDLIAFINAVVQAETMGTGIAAVLRVQAEQMRTNRRQRAEQQAYKAPVKMIFPLVLCIFPTLFIVILGPAGISIYENFVTKK